MRMRTGSSGSFDCWSPITSSPRLSAVSLQTIVTAWLSTPEAYVTPEMMDGDNKYHAGDDFGLQDAKKGTIFMEFPPVLHLHLKRFEYDFQRDLQVKVSL